MQFQEKNTWKRRFSQNEVVSVQRTKNDINTHTASDGHICTTMSQPLQNTTTTTTTTTTIIVIIIGVNMTIRTKPVNMNVETEHRLNGCNGASFGDHGVLEGDRIPSMNSRGQALE